MKLCDGSCFYGFINWWLKKSTVFKEIFITLAGLFSAVFVFGLLGTYINDLIVEPIIKFTVLTAIGFVLFHFMYSMCSAIIEKYAQMKESSIYDSLTGLYSRGYVPDAVSLTLAYAQRIGEDFCVFVFDGNNIKNVNDSYGHAMGDKAIKEIALKIKSVVQRHEDIIIRLSGDEYVILCTSKYPQKMYARMISELSEKEMVINVENSTATFTITVAVGMSSMATTTENLKGCTPDELYQKLFREADTLMYKNKRNRKKS